ncbi:ABC transporter ATP-binding protein [Oleiagrimonas sp. C23AA]|uniref:ABC transporter ATP-binding protein n=1 Tax=Oleiagrimonas sp. C23AA TaxID=2719047 RepID=UPI00141E9D50|nr:ABC transporter ATP-binding protein [Oleiagrimonas sp. C23AA]NII12277.1 ABC transporter ATP-binding protein [Oleiagrimonas sp. C23AA]
MDHVQMGAALHVQALVKRFGKREVISRLDWQVAPGRVIGLLGRNGAGKTTLLRCLLGLSPIDEGQITLFGEPLEEDSDRRLHRIGFVPQTFDLFPWMRVDAFLAFTAAFYTRWNAPFVERVLGEWDIDTSQTIGALSQGQRQKLAIVRALAPEPDLLLLDEPVASLDPQARRAFMDELMQVVAGSGKTVIFSTHITADLERAGADIALLKDGRIVLESTLAALRERMHQATLTRAGGWPETPALAGALRARSNGDTLTLLLDGTPRAELEALAQTSGASLEIAPATLEDVFVELA